MKKVQRILMIMLSCLMLVACGSSQYDSVIDDIIKDRNSHLEQYTDNDKHTNHIDKDKINIYSYEKGNVIVLEYPLEKADDYLVRYFYVKNLTTGKYDYDKDFEKKNNITKADYMQSHEPDYKEINIK